MSFELPRPVAAYFAAESRNDAQALAQCFTASAIVRDEGRIIEGVDAIKQWNRTAKEKYQHSVQPIKAFDRDGRTVVIGKVSGNFPNSPLNLEHIFELEGGKIALLEIR